jgi:hypothetical protein
MFPGLAAHPAVLTNMRGVYGDMVPEHAFALMLALARGMHRYAWLQGAHMWLKQEIVILAGKTMGVVGLGSIGGGVADRAVAFGMARDRGGSEGRAPSGRGARAPSRPVARAARGIQRRRHRRAPRRRPRRCFVAASCRR